MSLIAAGVVLASTIQMHRITLSDDELCARYESRCAAGARAADCGWLQRELEVRLLVDLQVLQQLGEPLDRGALQAAAAAEFPFLALFGLEQLQRIEGPEDEAAVGWAMDHPSRAVRSLARQVAATGRSAAMQARLQWGVSAPIWPTALDPGESDEWAAALMPETPRTLAELGLPEVAATYRPSMSEPAWLVFTTGEPPERVAAILARGQPTASGEEYMAATPEMDTAAMEALAKRMEGVTDQAKLTELTLELNELMVKAMAPMTDRRIVRDPQGRYFELPASADGQPRRIVGVGREATLGVTVISVLLP